MRRLLSLLSAGLFALALLVGVTLTSAPPAAAGTIAATTLCSNGVDNTGGLGLICEVTVNNTITATGGSAEVTVRECHGAAGDPEAACTVQTSVLTEPVTAVTQCNDSINGGGGTLRCSVQITNTFVGVSVTPTAVTVNQCVGSGGGITIGCDPFPATTTGATITQCNGSANGGTLVDLTCTASGTQALAHAVTINQCNDSANGGGALVICSSSITNVAATSASPTVAPSAPASSGPPSGTATPTVAPVPVFGVPVPSLFPGLPFLPDTGLADAAGTPLTVGALLALAGIATLGYVSVAAVADRRRR